LTVPRTGKSEAAKWVERAEALLATGASSGAVLMTGDHAVGQVVKLSGFGNRQGLDKAFKRVFGMPPAV